MKCPQCGIQVGPGMCACQGGKAMPPDKQLIDILAKMCYYAQQHVGTQKLGTTVTLIHICSAPVIK